jgi:nitrate/nitrite-specific signal transduction histidine kinase
MGDAFMHAEARHIEVEMAYGEKSLALRIRDDGKGMERGTVETGQGEHLGNCRNARAVESSRGEAQHLESVGPALGLRSN